MNLHQPHPPRTTHTHPFLFTLAPLPLHSPILPSALLPLTPSLFLKTPTPPPPPPPPPKQSVQTDMHRKHTHSPLLFFPEHTDTHAHTPPRPLSIRDPSVTQSQTQPERKEQTKKKIKNGGTDGKSVPSVTLSLSAPSAPPALGDCTKRDKKRVRGEQMRRR